MGAEWDEYIQLLDESAGLAGQEARGIDDANANYNAQARQLQNELAIAEREFKTLKDRNTRLQVGVRDLVRSLGVTVPVASECPRLSASQLSEALNSAEYDLGQIRKSLEYLKTQRQVAARLSVPVVPQGTPPTPVSNPAPSPSRSFTTVPMIIGVGITLLLIVILVVILL